MKTLYTFAPIFQLDFSSDSLITIAIALVAIAIGWLILRFVLKIAWRAFLIGCLGILILGAIVVGATFFLGS